MLSGLESRELWSVKVWFRDQVWSRLWVIQFIMVGCSIFFLANVNFSTVGTMIQTQKINCTVLVWRYCVKISEIYVHTAMLTNNNCTCCFMSTFVHDMQCIHNKNNGTHLYLQFLLVQLFFASATTAYEQSACKLFQWSTKQL